MQAERVPTSILFRPISPTTLDRLFAAGMWLTIVGVAWCVHAALTLTPAGSVTAYHLVWLGARATCFEKWRTERGLWMLALLFLVVTVAVWAVFTVPDFVALFQGYSVGLAIRLDLAGATLLVPLMARVDISIIHYNRRVSAGGPVV